MRVLIGGVGRPGRGDLALGLVAARRLADGGLPPGVAAADLSAAPLKVGDTAPDLLILIGAHSWGGRPGQVRRRAVGPMPGDAPGLLRDLGSPGSELPARTIAFEVEPGGSEAGEDLSAAAGQGLEEAVAAVRRELRRVPLLELTDRLRRLAAEVHGELRREGLAASPAFAAFRDLLHELAVADHEGGWGRAFELRDRLRDHIVAGEMGTEMDRLDHMEWSLVWALIEELDRLQRSDPG